MASSRSLSPAPRPDNSGLAIFAILVLAWLGLAGMDLWVLFRHFDAARPECCSVWQFGAIFSAGLIILPLYGWAILRNPQVPAVARV